MSYFEAGPMNVDDAREWYGWHGRVVNDLVQKMEERQSVDALSLEGFLTVSERLRTAIYDQALAASGQGRREFVVRAPMTPQEYRLLDTMAELMTNYAEILELRGIPYPTPPDPAMRVIETFLSARLAD